MLLIKKAKIVKANPSKWKRNAAKMKRNKGESYNSNYNKGVEVSDKRVRPPCNDKCKLKCSLKIDEEARKLIFDKYWSLGSLHLRQFIAYSMTEVTPNIGIQNKGAVVP